MGNCRSSTSVAVVSVFDTAKLILPDGQLEEFPTSVKVSEVCSIKKHESFTSPAAPACNYFICDSDEMEIGGFVTAMEDDQLLLPGQLYFALPLSWLGRPLQGEEIADLAYKASLVLGKSNSWLMSSEHHHRRRRMEVVSQEGIQISSNNNNVNRVGRKLSIIPEDIDNDDDQEA